MLYFVLVEPLTHVPQCFLLLILAFSYYVFNYYFTRPPESMYVV